MNQPHDLKTMGIFIIIFFINFWLIYQIAILFYKISNDKIQAIENTQKNQELEQLKKQKNANLAYLNTIQRKKKEAKMQMGRGEKGESVLVIIEDDTIPSIPKLKFKESVLLAEHIPHWKKWHWILFSNKPLPVITKN